MTKQKKVFTVQMLKVVFISIYFFKKAYGPLALGIRSVVCQPKLTKNKFKMKISKSSQKVLKQKGITFQIVMM